MKKVIKSFLATIIPLKKNRISIIDGTRYSGSNSTALYEFISNNNIETKYELKLFDDNSNLNLIEKIKKNMYIVSSRIIITTHSINRYKRKQILIQLWHGIPLKAMGLLDKTYSKEWIKNDKEVFDNVNNIVSTSRFYNTLLNATIGQSFSKYAILGYPRNDYLLRIDESINFNDIFNTFEIKNKVIFYIPTFKKGYANRTEGASREKNFFGIDNLDMVKFSNFLKDNKYNLVLKLHPFEEEYYKKEIKNMNLDNIFFLDTEILNHNNTDLYKWLAKSDMLITDYSSVYFDYLLTKKPMLFINSDEEEYRHTRGFILEPYEYWTPGPKVTNQDSLEKEIKKLFNESDYYLKERDSMIEIFHDYKDEDSSKRVWEFIEKNYLT